MRPIVRAEHLTMTLVGALAAILGTAAHAQAQAPKPAGATAPGTAPAAKAAPARPANWSEPLATVNGEKITRGDVIDFLSRYELPPADREQIYHDVIETLINTRLVTQFLDRQKIPVSEDRVNAEVSNFEKQLKSEGQSLAQALLESNKSMAEFRKELANRVRWIDYVKLKGTDAELRKYAEQHKDLLNGTQVRASHILLTVEPTASAAEKEKVRQKLLGIKRDIEAKKTTFADAANKFSQDPANTQQVDKQTVKAGGDIGYFGLKSGIVEEFGHAAFALKPGQISDPIETPYGYHLILVTDRKEGPKVDFEQNKPLIINDYAAELQKQILTAERQKAKVDIKPMPADIFPPAPPATAAPAPAAGAGAGGAPAPKAAPKAAQPK
jgi:peptidyl-prolyl cis-trans isomerase C